MQDGAIHTQVGLTESQQPGRSLHRVRRQRLTSLAGMSVVNIEEQEGVGGQRLIYRGTGPLMHVRDASRSLATHTARPTSSPRVVGRKACMQSAFSRNSLTSRDHRHVLNQRWHLSELSFYPTFVSRCSDIRIATSGWPGLSLVSQSPRHVTHSATEVSGHPRDLGSSGL